MEVLFLFPFPPSSNLFPLPLSSFLLPPTSTPPPILFPFCDISFDSKEGLWPGKIEKICYRKNADYQIFFENHLKLRKTKKFSFIMHKKCFQKNGVAFSLVSCKYKNLQYVIARVRCKWDKICIVIN